MEKLNDLNYVDMAEGVIVSLQKVDRKGNKKLPLTTSKIRNLLTMTNQIRNQVLKERSEKINGKSQSDIQYLKMRIAYEAGRDKIVREFVDKAGLMRHIGDIKDSKEQALLFCKYMEALVAYHRYHGGRDR